MSDFLKKVFVFFCVVFAVISSALVIFVGIPYALTHISPVYNAWGNESSLTEYFQDAQACAQAHDHLYFCKDLKR